MNSAPQGIERPDLSVKTYQCRVLDKLPRTAVSEVKLKFGYCMFATFLPFLLSFSFLSFFFFFFFFCVCNLNFGSMLFPFLD